MTHQTHIERLASREAAARARSAPVDDRDDRTVPAGASPHATDGLGGPWAVGSIVAGRFVLQQRLGRSRYGSIYKALDRSLSEALVGLEHHVALQELHPRIATQPTLLERLEQLPLHPQSWSHPNLVKLLEFGRDGAKYFLSAELLEGASLRFVLDDSAPEPLAYHEVLGVLRAVGDALNYAHAKGIVHGDLRPENVFVTTAYAVKVLDLLPSSEPRPVAFFVEDAESGGQPHPSDDVYGLACLAYELFTGRHPYNGNSPLEALRAGLAPQPVPDLPPLLWGALSRGLALRRERRTASVAELVAGLGVTGTEMLHPVEGAQPAPSPPAPARPATRWPEITVPPPDARHDRGAAGAAAPPAPAATRARPADPLFAEPVFDARAPVRAMRPPRSTHRSSPMRIVLGGVVAAALAVVVYRDYARLRIRAGDFIETASAFASEELAQWQAPSVAPERSVAGIDAESGGVPPSVPVPSAATTDPAAAVPAESTPDDGEAQAIETAARRTSESEATDARSALLPGLPSPAAQAPVSTPQFEFAERTVTVSEWEASARIVIRRTGSLDTAASVVWWTTDGTALADEDYAVLGARVERFAAGEESRVVHVPLVADSIPERRESFVVNLRADRAGSRAAVHLEVVVLDDDS
jgi:serine/threonine protein kinase